jgi:hypothetical protein
MFFVSLWHVLHTNATLQQNKTTTHAKKGDAELERHVASHGGAWAPDKFVALCARLPPRGGDAAADADAAAAARRFCERVMRAELRLLLAHCYARLKSSSSGGG